MADGIEIANTGKTAYTDEINVGGVLMHAQVMKLAAGGDGVATLVTTTSPYPIEIRAMGDRAVGKSSTYTKVTGTTATSGDQTLIAAPSAGNHLVIKDIVIQNESTVDTTIILKEGSTAAWRAKLLASVFASLAMSFEAGQEWRLASASALVLNLSGANPHGYSIRYFTEAD